ncbi:MAG: leucine-rich repeat domain-containing protein [Acutalibacteraceae bacterium]|nr:leucine-rich repeat domain-containing protein [Acutalibacteraceae bacterium]
MKKLLAVLMIGILAVSCTACGEDSSTDDTTGNSKTSTSDKADKSEDEAEENDKADSGEITVEALLNHEETAASDFTPAVDYEDESKWGIIGYEGTDDIVVVPETIDGETITFVGKYCFANRSVEKAIVFPDTVEKFEECACSLNEKVETVVLGANTKTIGNGAFIQCNSLKEVKLNDGLETICTQAFSMCKNLKSIYIPESVTTIEYGAFTMIEDSVVIHGKAGSAAEEYAKSENIQFVAE